MLTKSIYVSGVNNLSDARYCSGMGVDYIGVNVDEESSSYLPIEKFNEINGWVVGVNWIVESGATDFNKLLDKCIKYDIKRICVSDAKVARGFIENGYEVIIKTDELPAESANSPETLGYEIAFSEELLDAFEGGSMSVNSPIYLSGVISPENLERINSVESIYGVILIGGDELRPGFKNMDALIDAIEVFED
ncbi:MAG: phosphoribosylanthranilate isomerase [Spirosomataceae bacterium]|jgi:phosphoribosylanthranilate isomerase